MVNKLLIVLIVLALGLGGIYYIKIKGNESNEDTKILSPYKKGQENITSSPKPKVEKKDLFGDVINILLIGTDSSATRRADGQLGFNTDTMILLSANIKTNRILLTSVPRDLWINGNKINALHIVYGYETLEDAFEKITGQEIDGYIRTDFDGFRWLVDAFGGVPVEVQKSFTDNTFPNFDDSDIMSVTFDAGTEIMSGDRALTFARSRKGNNGEGSDLMRAKRQHLLLQGMVEGISQPGSQFWPMDIEGFYDTVTKHMETSLKVSDLYYLWDFYKDREDYEIESFVIDGTYIYHPGMYPESDYHAWVFIPREEGFTTLHADIAAKLEGTFIDPNALEPEGVGGSEPPQAITE